MKKITLFMLMFLMALTLGAQALEAQEQPEAEGSETALAQPEPVQPEAAGKGNNFSHSITFIASTLPEAKVQYSMNWKLPFMQGGNPLTSGNNLRLSLTPELSPVFLYLNADAALTPIAFFVLNLGGMVGTGWHVNLFRSDLYGIGLNIGLEKADGKTYKTWSGKGFDGAFLFGRASGTLQMDMGALFPGDWNHVLIQSKHEINYKYYSGAQTGESWHKEADSGENVNGWNYYGNLTLGYQMPIFLKMVALQAEGDLYLNNDKDLPNRKQWGDDLMRWTFGGILQFNFKGLENLNALVITQFTTPRVYTDLGPTGEKTYEDKGKDVPYWNKYYYQTRHIDTAKPRKFNFYRVAFIFSYSL
jgi:hypothetical protein